MRPFTPKSRLSFEITHEFKNNSSLILTQALKLIHLYFWQKKLNNFELKQMDRKDLESQAFVHPEDCKFILTCREHS